jgi:hypothetical protein
LSWGLYHFREDLIDNLHELLIGRVFVRVLKKHPDTPLVALFAQDHSVVLILVELIDQVLDHY